MSNEREMRPANVFEEVAATTSDVIIRKAITDLRTAVAVGDISNSTGVAIGSNIHMVVNRLDLPAAAVAEILAVRNQLGAVLGLDPGRYRLDDLLIDKTRRFVGRSYVFGAISEFIGEERCGYFSIRGDPGMGKSAILAEYVRRTGCISHFNVRSAGVTSAGQFLENVCTQLIVDFGLPYANLSPAATKDGAFLSRLLKDASSKLQDNRKLVIAVDALDEVDLSGHPPGANILYLPPILPDGVYVIMTSRNLDLPMIAKSPQNGFDMMAHGQENREDVEAYIRENSTSARLQAWFGRQRIDLETFTKQLAMVSENNFMYLRYVLPEVEEGTYNGMNFDDLPVGLHGYYDDHWRHMGMTAKPLPRVKIRIIYVLCEVRKPISRQLISELATDRVIHADELTVQEVLDEWRQFLHKTQIAGGSGYAIYHASFREFLHRKEVVQAAGVMISGINSLIADNLLVGLGAMLQSPP